MWIILGLLLWLLGCDDCNYHSGCIMPLKYSFSELDALQNSRYKTPAPLLMHRHLGILWRPKYCHRSLGRTVVYQQHSNNIPSLWSSHRREVVGMFPGFCNKIRGRFFHYVPIMNSSPLSTHLTVNCDRFTCSLP